MSQNPYGSYGSQPQQPTDAQQPAQPGYGSYGQQSAPTTQQTPYGYSATSPYTGSQPVATPYGVVQDAAAQPGAPRPQVGIGGAFKNWFKYMFHFSGRASRSEFWWVYGPLTALYSIALTIGSLNIFAVLASYGQVLKEYDALPDGAAKYDAWLSLREYRSDVDSHILVVVLILLALGVLYSISLLALTWRRMQDAGFPGFLALFNFVSLNIIPFVLSFFPSSPKGLKFDKEKDYSRP